jgi:hypothetical protein
MKERNVQESDYAMMVHLLVKDRINKYNEGDGKRIQEALLEIYNDKSLMQTSTSSMTIMIKMTSFS